MRKVEMSEAGLQVLLARTEPLVEFYERWGSVVPGAKSQIHADTAEAVREARARLGLPPRQPAEPWPSPARPPHVELADLRRQAKARIDLVMAIENKYPDGQITDPVDEADVQRLVKEAIALEERIDQIEDARTRRIRRQAEFC